MNIILIYTVYVQYCMNLLTPFPFKTKRAVQKKLKFAVGIFMNYVK